MRPSRPAPKPSTRKSLKNLHFQSSFLLLGPPPSLYRSVNCALELGSRPAPRPPPASRDRPQGRGAFYGRQGGCSLRRLISQQVRSPCHPISTAPLPRAN